MKVLVTGAAGFIGFHVANALLGRGDEVVGLDNFNDYYDPNLKESRVALLAERAGFEMVRGDLADSSTVDTVFKKSPDRVVHLAAQVGVRNSLKNPRAYTETNTIG
ncbi:MAG: GDP-mannose 4,6-dehydratase, partial [Gammaproteobacteria bacterium]